MSVTVVDVLKLPSFQDKIIVAGINGINRDVRWVHMAELLDNVCDIISWVEGNEMIMITGTGIKSEEMFLDFVKLLSDHNISGLLIFIGKYIDQVPDKVIEFANALDFPIITVPWAVPAVKITSEVCEYIVKSREETMTIRSILEGILFMNNIEIDVLVNQANFYGYDLKKSHRVMIVDINAFSVYIKANKIMDESLILDIKDRFFKMVEYVLRNYYDKYLTTMISDSVICLVPSKESSKAMTIDIADEIRVHIKQFFADLTVNVTIGNAYSYAVDFKKSLVQAQKTLSILKQIGDQDVTRCYDDLGADMLLIELKDNKVLYDFYKGILGKIIRYDKTNKSELFVSLKTYLDENSNSNKSAEKLFIHRNTLKYRLDKIQDITGYDLQDAKTVFNLKLAFQISRLL